MTCRDTQQLGGWPSEAGTRACHVMMAASACDLRQVMMEHVVTHRPETKCRRHFHPHCFISVAPIGKGVIQQFPCINRHRLGEGVK